MTTHETATRIRQLALTLPDSCWDISLNLLRDAEELEKRIIPGSEESWRANWIGSFLGG